MLTAKRKAVLGTILAGVLLLMTVGFLVLKPTGTTDLKRVQIIVVSQDGSEGFYETPTTAAFLQGAMDDTKDLTYQGRETAMGFILEEVNGERAVYDENKAFWGITIGGQFAEYGISQQPIADGDVVRIAYTMAVAEPDLPSAE